MTVGPRQAVGGKRAGPQDTIFGGVKAPVSGECAEEATVDRCLGCGCRYDKGLVTDVWRSRAVLLKVWSQVSNISIT